jgi:hypothetical protein
MCAAISPRSFGSFPRGYKRAARGAKKWGEVPTSRNERIEARFLHLAGFVPLILQNPDHHRQFAALCTFKVAPLKPQEICRNRPQMARPVLSCAPNILPLSSTCVVHRLGERFALCRGHSDQRVELSCSLKPRFRR